MNALDWTDVPQSLPDETSIKHGVTKVFRKIAFAVAALALTASSASAATVTQNGVSSVSNSAFLSVGDDVTFFESLSATDLQSLYSFSFTALQNMKISFVAMAATGASGGADINKVRFGFDNPPTETYDAVTALPGGAAFATGSLPSFNLSAGDVFSVFFAEVVPLAKSVGATSSFTVPAVPAPASLSLLLSALAGFTILGRRRRSANR